MNHEDIQKALIVASPEEKVELLALLDELEKRQLREKAQNDFLKFVETQWPDFISGAHHRRIAKLFEDIANGKKKRLIINLSPRHTKSEFASFLFPAWFLGRNPKSKIIQVSNTSELAEGFGRKVRNLLDTDEYQAIFPNVELRPDSKAAGRWNTNHGGEYYSAGVGSALAGRGANLAIVDDPHTESEALQAQFNPGIYDKVYDWYTSGIRQRLQPGAAIIIVMTRWALRDLTGQVLETAANNPKSDQWEVFEFPAILPSGKPLWPEYWSLDELLAIKAELPPAKWNAQYQQNPISDDSAIIKKQYWKIWGKDHALPSKNYDKPPPIDYIIMALDTAFEAKKSADYSACLIFGVWQNTENITNQNLNLNQDQDTNPNNLILLNAWREKLEFPELKAKVLELYKEWKPDSTIIEKKASGAPLIYELRRMGIPVQEFTPSRGNDKIVRLNAIADIFASGKVWAPPTRWAEEVIDELAAFPAGRYDDYVDCASSAVARFRAGGFIGTQHDKDYDEEEENGKLYLRQKLKAKPYY